MSNENDVETRTDVEEFAAFVRDAYDAVPEQEAEGLASCFTDEDGCAGGWRILRAGAVSKGLKMNTQARRYYKNLGWEELAEIVLDTLVTDED